MEEANKIGEEYLEHMKEKTSYYHDLAKDVVGRDIKHILLIHLNYINSIYLPELLKWYEKSGWKFISAQDALEGPVFELPDRYTGPRGLSWIERI